MPMTATEPAALRVTPADDAAVLETLAPGSTFDALEMSGRHCWGQARASGLVGYVDAVSLVPAAA